jgi:hypothetical protein
MAPTGPATMSAVPTADFSRLPMPATVRDVRIVRQGVYDAVQIRGVL